jgi:MASE1/Histidine kinase
METVTNGRKNLILLVFFRYLSRLFYMNSTPRSRDRLPTILKGVIATALSQLALAYVSLFIHNLYPVWSAPLWPASGAALAAVLLGGPWMLVGVYLGLLPSQFFFWGVVPTSTALFLPLANTVETALAWLLLRKVARGFHDWISTQRDIVIFLIAAPWIPTLISALLAQALLRHHGIVPSNTFFPEALVYALGNASGIILVTPLVLVWRDYLKFPWLTRTGLRLIAHSLVVVISVWIIQLENAFSTALFIGLIPIFIWGVWSTGVKGATISCLFLSFIFFSWQVRKPFDLHLIEKHSDTTILTSIQQSYKRKNSISSVFSTLKEPLTLQVSMLTVFCLTMLPLGLAADTLRTNAQRDQLVMDSLDSTFWSWDSITGLKIQSKTIAQNLPSGVSLFQRRSPTGQIKLNPIDPSQPSYVSHWVITQFSPGGEPLQATGLLHCLRLQEKMEKAEANVEIAQMEIASLRSRFNPHLLFNCLTGLRALIRRDPISAREFTGHLARFLRTAVDSQARPLVLLKEEISLCRDYLALEQMRGSTIVTKLSFPRNTMNTLIPPMSIQTLMENAVKHGTRDAEGKLNIQASAILTKKNNLLILVSQPGIFSSANSAKSSGGLMLARQHLALLCGEEANLVLREDPPGTVIAEMQLPAIKA